MKLRMINKCGLVIGVLIALCFGVTQRDVYPNLLMTERIFGELKLVPYDLGSKLKIERNNQMEMAIHFDKNRNFSSITFCDSFQKPRVKLFRTKSFWRVKISAKENSLEDWNFDGVFDFSKIENENLIFLNQEWVKIAEFNSQTLTALIGKETYSFDQISGWKIIP